MKAKILRVIFPFYVTEKHDFLMQKWWFRLSLVCYALFIMTLPLIFMSNTYDSFAGWCYDTLPLYYGDLENFDTQLDKCSEITNEAQPYIWLSGIMGPIIVHYLIQSILFKIIINFIVLGGKK